MPHSLDHGGQKAGSSRVGVVVIGRNEGARLTSCLQSLAGRFGPVVYADSGSTDDSVAQAAALGAKVLELDPAHPFNAGRAREEGFRFLRKLHPEVTYVQFVDGDCELAAGWCAAAVSFLDAHPDVAAVGGRRRERHPESSIYNAMFQLEWDAHPVGEALCCAGDVMMRASALAAVGGFRRDLLSGEEQELCIRLRAAGWRIWFLRQELTLHDAAMTHLHQWWRRGLRSGYGALQGAALYGGPPEYHCIRAIAGAWFWAVLLPLVVVLLLPERGPAALLLLLLYPLQVLRLALLGDVRNRGSRWWALFALVNKFPHVLGQVQCLTHRCLRRKARLIEYKST